MSYPVDEIKQILLASLDGDVRAALDSKIHLLRLARAEALHARRARVVGARQGEKTQAINEWWSTARIEAESTAEKLIAACIDMGVTDDDVISNFVSTDLKIFLESSASSLGATLSRGILAMAYATQFAALKVQAGPLASRVPHKVRVYRFEASVKGKEKDLRDYPAEPNALPRSAPVTDEQEDLGAPLQIHHAPLELSSVSDPRIPSHEKSAYARGVQRSYGESLMGSSGDASVCADRCRDRVNRKKKSRYPVVAERARGQGGAETASSKCRVSSLRSR
jgi:hypothetical protein